MMRDPATGGPHTAHTTNPVPALLLGDGNVSLAAGLLADVAPTLLELMGLPQPSEMTGRSLLRASSERSDVAQAQHVGH
jgi:2,3-bisphosphoglycerate-independent phosphoglycerate mutase